VLTALSLGMFACSSPATVDGTAGDHEFSRIKTGFFDTYDDGSGVYYMFFSDYGWTCDELQTAYNNDSAPAISDSNLVVGSAIFLPFVLNDDYSFGGVTQPGTYDFVDINVQSAWDLLDLVSLETGANYATGTIQFMNEIGTVEDNYLVTGGQLEITDVDLTKSISGTYNIGLDDSSVLQGKFDLEFCPFSDAI
jgi:hypothetical protein